MTNARDLLAAGKLREATEMLIAEVKANPVDTSKRTFLFELSCFAGDWDRAERQLDVIGLQDVQAALGVTVYRANVKAERERARVFSEGIEPHFLSAPPPYVDLYIAAIRHLHKGELTEARGALAQAEEERTAVAGKLGHKSFEDFRDCDDFVGGVLEVIVKDRYVWLPFEQIKRLEIMPPTQLRDFLWARVQLEAWDGTVGELYLPSLYAGTNQHDDDNVKLGRVTDWKQIGDDLFRSFGLRLFAIDQAEESLFETGVLEFNKGA
ncbi:MAG TPA: type VI secretion system accessory protein TagJ [Pyrinomonadaceae bacterium]|nr:type VI secretion system accessory protein TagJ [Pyrinomonadaceae bacterium]